MCSIVRNNGPTAVKSPVEEMLRYIDSLPDDPPKAKVEIRTRKFWAAVWSEFLATLLLIVVTSPSTGEVDVRQSLAVGASAALLTYTLQGAAFNPAVSIPRCLFSHTGVGLNPVRALGQVLVARNWTNHWVYWIGPLLGGLIGGFTYDYARSSRKDVQEQAERTSRQRELDRERGLRRGLSALSQDTEMTNSLNTNDCRV
ncbi:putative uncharacterized protein SCRG_04940 isoform X2 [Varroa destructor]|uniref:Uncharacterized protein n=1 Tax=Varroa destructor TaxID=109461 RepID=A0A7M7J987_VARDE|nr:putative uncharacterized protein SCRG_04940 isoform X2 [Varroa destructor]